MKPRHWTHDEIRALLVEKALVRVTLDPLDSAPVYDSVTDRYSGPGQIGYYRDDNDKIRTEASGGATLISWPHPSSTKAVDVLKIMNDTITSAAEKIGIGPDDIHIEFRRCDSGNVFRIVARVHQRRHGCLHVSVFGHVREDFNLLGLPEIVNELAALVHNGRVEGRFAWPDPQDGNFGPPMATPDSFGGPPID